MESKKNPKIRCRLDYFLIETKHINTVKSCKILPSISSDHDIIEITMNIDKTKRGPGFWKLNNSLLNDNSYKSEIEKLIEDTWEKHRILKIQA